MSHRREIARASDRKVSIDSSVPGGAAESSDRTIADTIAAPETSPEQLDADWREAVLKSAVEHVLTKTAISERDRNVYREYALDGRDIGEAAAQYRISRNSGRESREAAAHSPRPPVSLTWKPSYLTVMTELNVPWSFLTAFTFSGSAHHVPSITNLYWYSPGASWTVAA